MSTVYVTQENPRLNYSDAERYGEVVFVNTAEWNPNANSKVNEEILHNIFDELDDFQPEVDYLLLSGDPISMLMCFNHAAEAARQMDMHRLRVLKWDGQTRKYNPIILDIKVFA